MCGIAGWVDFERDLSHQEATVESMSAVLSRRGPDSAGVWRSPHALLAHRRLAIIDLVGGAQPMLSRREGHEVVLSYTGEVYNFAALRAELLQRGHAFLTRSDTEVVLHAYLQWGASFVDRLNGMFAFALWDGSEQQLLLVRDRLGIKPLYYAALEGGLVFGSEPKAILAHPQFRASIDFPGLLDALSLCRRDTQTPFSGIRELSPGCMLIVTREHDPQLKRYWRLPRVEIRDTEAASVDRVHGILSKSVDMQLVADVPLCTLLSGGLDSSLLTALARRVALGHKTNPVRSFSVDFVGQDRYFRGDGFRPDRDQPFAVDAARFIGTRHETILLDNTILTSQEAREAVGRAFDFPTTFGDVDTSLLLLMRAVREHSTVAISGEAADEVFGGYNWFRDQEALASPRFPWLSRMQLIEPAFFKPDFAQAYDLGRHQEESYREALSQVEHLADDSPQERQMRTVTHMHLTRWLPILLDRKDRLSMYAGLEVRVPFTDHWLVEYVYNLPWAYKSEGGVEKSLLKKVAVGLLPESVLARSKSPYPTSANLAYEAYLRGKVRQLLSQSGDPVFRILSRVRLARELDRAEGYFDSQVRRNNLETALMLSGWVGGYALSV